MTEINLESQEYQHLTETQKRFLGLVAIHATIPKTANGTDFRGAYQLNQPDQLRFRRVVFEARFFDERANIIREAVIELQSKWKDSIEAWIFSVEHEADDDDGPYLIFTGTDDWDPYYEHDEEAQILIDQLERLEKAGYLLWDEDQSEKDDQVVE